MRMHLVDIQCLLLPTLDYTLFMFFFGIQQNVTRPDPRNIYSNWYGLRYHQAELYESMIHYVQGSIDDSSAKPDMVEK